MALFGISPSSGEPARWRPLLRIALAFGMALGCRAGQAQPVITLQQVVTGLSSPVAITNAGDGSGRLFITQQCGQIVIFEGGGILPTPFLDVSSLVSSPCTGGGSERGLLSVAFHPSYTTNGYFYVYYTNTSGNIVVSRYTVSSDPNVGDPSSAQIVITIPHPGQTNHNGGQLQFGPDGYLYLGTGDGGSGGDPPNNAQNLTVLLGKILRIDIDAAGAIPCGQSTPAPYGIPASNPFAGSPTDCQEIWAYGVRNPWRFSFDRSTGDLLIGDVGQNLWEELDFQPAGSTGGENYGWRLMEGFHCYNPPTNCNDGTLTLPILEYSHSFGCSITGGYRYRGTQFPQLDGTYLYADYCSGRIWGATQNCSGNWMTTELLQPSYLISTFGEDEAGEIYLVDYGVGTLYHVSSTPDYPFPVTSGISPSSAIAGGSAFTLTVNGTGFARGSVVRWNGSDRATAYVCATQLTASIPASDIAAVGTAAVTVFNPAPGGGVSNGQTFNINATFLDVPTSYWAYIYIQAVANAGITAGCGGGNYCPEAAVSRAQMAVFLLRAEHGSSYLPPACAGIFQDVACMPTPAFAVDWIEQLSIEGITAGCGGGNYCPDNPVTRAQMAVFLLRAEHGSSYLPPACTGIFQDVACTPTPAFAVDWIEQLSIEGVTAGCGGGNYCPDNPNTRAQMAVFLVKTFNLPLP